MRGAVFVAIAATIGDFLQGWDNATIAGAIIYAKKDLGLDARVEGLVVAMSLIGATVITTFSGAICDWIGRRSMLIVSSVFYFASGLVMLWSPNVYVLCLARLLDGFGVGLTVTLIPLYVSETSPPEIRGMLNTLPQFAGSTGMFLSYCMIFGMSLADSPNWRLMLGVLSIPSFVFFALTVFFLPESPRWLVSKGKMLEAKRVVQRLRGKEDVSGELALLVEGLGIGGEISIEEYIIGPADEHVDGEEQDGEKDSIVLYGPEEGLSWVAKPVSGKSSLGHVSHHGSLRNSSVPLMDPLVSLFGSVHEKLPATGSTRSMFFPNFGSMFSTAEGRDEHWDEESLFRHGEDYASEAAPGYSDDDLHSPLMSRQTTSMDNNMLHPASHGSLPSMRRHSTMVNEAGEPIDGTGIGGGWQLAWKWSERVNEDGKKDEGFKRIYLHEGAHGSQRGSLSSLPGSTFSPQTECVQAAALVSQPALYSRDLMDQNPVGPAMIHPSETATKVSIWTVLCTPGVKCALIVGIGIQMLQQLSGINGVLYYTPQILKEGGVEVLLANLGISSESASFLISALTTLLMLPCIGVGMRLMDRSGRRRLLLTTVPVLICSLIILVISQVVDLSSIVNAAISVTCVITYICCFVAAYGPIPNILCSEIFPTRVRGVCISICALVFWLGNTIVTYTLPVLLSAFGLGGVFGVCAVFCIISWVFIFLKVPETKGMPLEVISEFFAVGAKQSAVTKNE